MYIDPFPIDFPAGKFQPHAGDETLTDTTDRPPPGSGRIRWSALLHAGPARLRALRDALLRLGAPPRLFRRLQWVLIATTVLLVVAAVPTGLMVAYHRNELGEYGRYDSVFSNNRIVTELLRFEVLAGSADLVPPRASVEELQLWYEILINRHAVLSHGNPVVTARDDPGHRDTVRLLGETLERAAPLLAEWRPGNGARLLDLFEPLNASIAQLVTSINTRWTQRVALTQERLTELHAVFSVLLGGMLFCSVGSGLLLAWQNRRARHAADHDILTGLPNRAVLRRRMQRAVEAPSAGRGTFLLMLDLDRFKDVNDTLGHPAGDALLCGIALRLRERAPPDALVARLGGDEFAVLLADTGPAEAERIARDIIAGVNRPFALPGRDVLPGVSIGIAEFGRHGRSAAEVMKHADLALYSAKTERRGGARMFQPVMAQELETRLSLLADLPAALGGEQFQLLFQPVLSLADRRVAGMEALLRWRHPERGLVMPGVFIPLAEECGLIDDIGLWVLRRACAEAADWPEPVLLAVNLSARQLDRPDMVGRVMAVLAETGLPPTRLELEITESALMRDGDAVKGTLDALRAAGVRMALDDFGTGYASLGYLRRFPFDRLKIDRSFVVDLLEREESRVIVRNLARMAAQLGMATTAEGLETEAMARLAQELGCTEGQGYHFSRPLGAAEARARLEADRAPPERASGALA